MSGANPEPLLTAHKTGYQGFGSFHSDNVEVLISIPSSHYVPPSAPFDIPHVFSCLQNTTGSGQDASVGDINHSTLDAQNQGDDFVSTAAGSAERRMSNSGASVGPSSQHARALAAPAFGKACRDLFLIDFKQWTFLNHGAFGGVCKPAYLEADLWRRHCEAQPLNFLDRCVLRFFSRHEVRHQQE